MIKKIEFWQGAISCRFSVKFTVFRVCLLIAFPGVVLLSKSHFSFAFWALLTGIQYPCVAWFVAFLIEETVSIISLVLDQSGFEWIKTYGWISGEGSTMLDLVLFGTRFSDLLLDWSKRLLLSFTYHWMDSILIQICKANHHGVGCILFLFCILRWYWFVCWCSSIMLSFAPSNWNL